MKVIVCQYGARHRYAIPRVLHQNSFLAQLITGSHSASFSGKLVSSVSSLIPITPSMKRLENRIIQGVSSDLIFSSDLFSLIERPLYLIRDLSSVSNWLKLKDYLWFYLVRKHIKWDGADFVYSMMDENLALLHEAKKRGLKVITDVVISPVYLRQMLTAKTALSIKASAMEQGYLKMESHYKEVFQHSDIILCPSQWVADGVVELAQQFEKKIRICAYGSSLKYSENNSQRMKNRVFWAGSDWFRKGLHHLAGAADILKSKYPDLDFRAAGITDPNVINMPMFKNINFLGKLDKSQMQQEFGTSSMFVFPTLTEGMAGVVLEAISNGCPVITTRASGVDALKNGKGGLIINSLSSEILSKAIESLLLDQPRLLQMSSDCMELYEYYSENSWRLRLQDLLISNASLP